MVACSCNVQWWFAVIYGGGVVVYVGGNCGGGADRVVAMEWEEESL